MDGLLWLGLGEGRHLGFVLDRRLGIMNLLNCFCINLKWRVLLIRLFAL